MSWIMSHYITERPRKYHFCIGGLEIASVHFVAGDAILLTKCESEAFPSMSAALKRMHERLNAAPEEERE